MWFLSYNFEFGQLIRKPDFGRHIIQRKFKSNYYLLNLRNTDIIMQFCTLCYRETETSNSSERGKEKTLSSQTTDEISLCWR